MYVVTVDFRLHPEHIETFLPLMLDQAQNSLTKEPGCRVFDVCQDPQSPAEVFLYEVYNDRAAFDVHMASDHYRAFDAAVSGLVAQKRVRLLNRR